MAPPAIIATPGAANANCYVTLVDADTYFASRAFGAAWAPATPDQKTLALEYATTLLDRQKWMGVKGISPSGGLTQALAWPRRWAPTLEYDAEPQVVAEYFVDISSMFYSELTIPKPIVHATCELALEILAAGTTDPFVRSGDPARDVKRKVVDVLETEYFDLKDRAKGLGRFASVMELIRPVLRSSGGAEIQRV